jgi:hypothetical protein
MRLLSLREEAQRTLFEKLCHAVVGHSTADIAGAATNLLLTVVQRRHIRLADAEAHWDELMGRGRVALQRRYGKRQDSADEHEMSQRIING